MRCTPQVKSTRRGSSGDDAGVAQDRLPFEYEVREDAARVTAWSGLPLLVEVMRKFEVPEAIREHLNLFDSPRDFDEETVITALVLLLSAGGENLADLRPLKNDEALKALLGFELPSPETARQFLYLFHSEALVKEAEATLGPEKKSCVPEENPALKGLAKVVQALTHQIQRQWPQKVATVDFDTTFQESHKREAKEHYEGGTGYQPMLATWVEQKLVVFDEFRDGNVAPHHAPLEVVKKGFAGLPAGLSKRRMRGDSAMYSLPLMRWLCAEEIEFAIGAHVREGLRKKCEALKEARWTHLQDRADSVLHIAEVANSPKGWRRNEPSLRYIAIRITPTQRELYDEERVVRHLAIVSNSKMDAASLVRWYWEKGGTIEHVHAVLKNDLGAGVFPCGRFGSNAAWLRLCVLTHNLLRIVRAVGPAELADAKPKRIRLHLLAVPALLRRHARRLFASVSKFTALVSTRVGLWGLPSVPLGSGLHLAQGATD
jgi:hypothetical protein